MRRDVPVHSLQDGKTIVACGFHLNLVRNAAPHVRQGGGMSAADQCSPWLQHACRQNIGALVEEMGRENGYRPIVLSFFVTATDREARLACPASPVHYVSTAHVFACLAAGVCGHIFRGGSPPD